MNGRLILLAGLLVTSAASAQVTHVYFEASTDRGATWASAATVMPGVEVSVRVRVRLDLAGTTRTSMGFGGITFQPTLTSWTRGDTAIPFADTLWSNSPVNAYGRVYPFGVPSDPTTIPPRFTYFESGGVLRIAGVRNIKAPGLLSWGLNLAQYPLNLSPTRYDSSLDVVVFRFGFVAGSGARTMLADANPEWVNNKRGTWFTSASGTGPIQASLTRDTIHPAAITIVPCPLGGLAMGWLVCRRSRRGA